MVTARRVSAQPSPPTLTEFLLARIADVERVARDAGGEWWYPAEVPGMTMRKDPDRDADIIIDSPKTLVAGRVVSHEMAQHIVSHDPARVLADLTAKRRIVRLMGHVLESWSANHGGDGRSMWPDVNRRERHHARTILEALALPYADHPDYQEDWAP